MFDNMDRYLFGFFQYLDELETTEKNKPQKGLHLMPAVVSDEYKEKWNCKSTNDFVWIAKDGIPLSKNLYRVGGLQTSDIKDKKYFVLLKQVEDFYNDSITTDPKRKRHLSNVGCILDSNGKEKYVADSAYDTYIFLIPNSVIFSIKKKYYNVETLECYGEADEYIESDSFVFLEFKYSFTNKSKRGTVLKINKKDGTTEIFK